MGAAISRGMAAFARFASAKPHRLVLLTILGLQFLAPVAASMLVLAALRRGPEVAFVSAALALGGVLLIGVLVGSDPVEIVSLAAPTLFAGTLSGVVLATSRSLSLAFQATVVGSIGGVAVVFGLFPAARGLGEFLKSEMLALLEAGGLAQVQLETMAQIQPEQFAQIFVFGVFASVLAALMLGFWWYALITEGVSFGRQFRALRLGRLAGIGLMLLVTANVIFAASLIQLLAYMAVAGFLFQGLAVVHARSRSDNWHRAVLVMVYVLLVSPLTGIASLGLSAIGLLDNFFALRRGVEARN